MTADEINIPKIALNNETPGVQNESSVLVPKANIEETHIEGGGGRLQPKMEAGDKKGNGLLIKISIGFMALILFILVAIGMPAFLTYQKGLVLYKSVKDLEAAAKAQDLTKIKSQIDVTNKSLAAFKTSYLLLSWTKIVPYLGGYVSDLGHGVNAAQAGLDAGTIVITAIEPYSDLLGFKGANGQQIAPTDGAKTAQDRIDFVVKSLPSLLPQIDKISGKMKVVENEVSQINAERYPIQFKGIQVRSSIKTGQELVNQASTLLVNGKPVIENAPTYWEWTRRGHIFYFFKTTKS